MFISKLCGVPRIANSTENLCDNERVVTLPKRPKITSAQYIYSECSTTLGSS